MLKIRYNEVEFTHNVGNVRGWTISTADAKGYSADKKYFSDPWISVRVLQI